MREALTIRRTLEVHGRGESSFANLQINFSKLLNSPTPQPGPAPSAMPAAGCQILPNPVQSCPVLPNPAQSWTHGCYLKTIDYS